MIDPEALDDLDTLNADIKAALATIATMKDDIQRWRSQRRMVMSAIMGELSSGQALVHNGKAYLRGVDDDGETLVRLDIVRPQAPPPPAPPPIDP